MVIDTKRKCVTMKKSLIAAAFAIALPTSTFAENNGETLCVEFEENTYFCTEDTRRIYDRTADGRRSRLTSRAANARGGNRDARHNFGAYFRYDGHFTGLCMS